MCEIICWAVLWLLIGIEVAGIGYMVFSGQAEIHETDFDVAEADLIEPRAQSARR